MYEIMFAHFSFFTGEPEASDHIYKYKFLYSDYHDGNLLNLYVYFW